jgi:DEAD/DEAH box helicase domain-containing protein
MSDVHSDLRVGCPSVSASGSYGRPRCRSVRVQSVTTVRPEPTALLHSLLCPRGVAASGPSGLADTADTARPTARPARAGTLTHVERVPPRTGERAPWPPWVPAGLRTALACRGVEAPWKHQAEAASLAWSGRHVVVATGTASGKSLAYQLPTLSRVLADRRATALYIAPTKALAADQLRAVNELDQPDVCPAIYDGDTPRAEREWIRQHSRLVLTNPDMLHHAVLPGHAGWVRFFRSLTYVIVDECHAYRGVFGSHVAHVLRRLRRIATRYGQTPTFVLASATVGDPTVTAHRLTGLDVQAVTRDTSPRGGVTFALWEPPMLDEFHRAPTSDDPSDDGPPDDGPTRADAAAVRRSALRETADLLADAVIHGVRTLAFVRSRRGVEVVAAAARRSLDEASPGLGEQVAAYRGGYLREERRALERAFMDGSLMGLAATNALELGVDLAGLDAVLLAGFPGTLASLWQQAGRAGRAGQESLCVMVARDDPLDTYLVHHPEALFSRPVEATVLDPANRYVLGPHLACAAAELPLTATDIELFGGAPAEAAVKTLVAAQALRQRPTGWYWTQRGRPDVDLRGTGGAPVSVVESATGRLLGTVDQGSAHSQVHPGAVHLHQGASYVVDDLDLDDAVALVHAEEPDWTTHPRDITNLSIHSVRSYVDAGAVGLFLGEVDVTAQVVAYQRRRISTGEVIDTRLLNLPQRSLHTVAVWWTLSPRSLEAVGLSPTDVPGALHAAEHAAIGLLPLVATCDRWDIGGLSTAEHPDTEAPTIFVYDGHPGGAGFAERAYAVAEDWLGATHAVIAGCACEGGCPSCVQSPKCGNGNSPLDKDGAVNVLDVVLRALGSVHSG